MSLIINSDGEYLSGSGTVFATTGLSEFTVAVCVKRDVASSAYQSYMYLGREPTDSYGSIWIAHNANGPDCFTVPSGASRRVAGGTGADTTNWQWLFETYKKDVEHKTHVAQIGGSVTSFSEVIPTEVFNADIDHIRIGLGTPLANDWYPRCKLAQPVFWDVCLTSAQIADLVSGGSGGISKNPQAIASANLKFYASLASDATVTVGGVSLSATGTLTYDGADNPNVDSYGGGTTAYTLVVDSGTYTLSGQTLSTPLSVSATLDAGTYSITGQDVGLGGSVSYTLTLDSGAYNMTSETPVIGISMGLDSGSYSSTGQDITLSASIGGGGTTYSLSLDAGDYVVTGQDLAMITSYLASLDAGIYTVNGSNVRLVSSTEPVIVSSGTHTISVSIKIGI